jgi:hypothetical protein
LPKNIQLDVLITPAEQKRMGIHKLTSKEKERLRVHIVNIYLQGPAGTAMNSSAMPSVTKTTSSSTSTIESNVDGDFEGWEGETIVKLINGQIWQQTEYYYHYHYAYGPEVLIYRSGGGYKMKVEGIEKPVMVSRLR